MSQGRTGPSSYQRRDGAGQLLFHQWSSTPRRGPASVIERHPLDQPPAAVPLAVRHLIVRTLMPLVHTLVRLGWNRRFAADLNAARRPFHLINYLGSVAGGQLLTPSAMTRLIDGPIRALQRRLATETDTSLALTMHFPPAWDPYFQPSMTRPAYVMGGCTMPATRRRRCSWCSACRSAR